ncbi:MAG: helix-turn-helix transcriptional regulator [Holosporaceae bacterium]|jgi:transcriptional regulator with XRE-family HTH domain|nr:helix-turn-helix transcriptional regulator [Holosporaceae bacterium]
MARQSLSPMKEVDFGEMNQLAVGGVERVGRKRKDAPMTHLKYLRKRSGYTLETLSEITSISISYLSRLESGSRRLNTDLIRRLSHAFRCEPAELLQEISHESRIVSPIEFSRNRGRDNTSREANMPLYCVAQDENNEQKLIIKICSPSEWRLKPSELSAKEELLAVKAESYFLPHFSCSSTLYLEATNNLVPEATVVILKKGEVLIKKIWSVTPTNLQLCDIPDIDSLKDGSKSKEDRLLEVDRNSVDTVYKVVGYSDFNVA